MPEPVQRPGATLARGDVYRDRLVDGRLAPATFSGRLVARARELLRTQAEREERALETRIAAAGRRLTRTNHVAVVSPKGGVGKTTCTLLAGDALARLAKLRCVAVDANPDYGTLASLASDAVRTERSLADLLERVDELSAPGELRAYVSPLASGLHLLAAPARAEVMATMTPEHYRAVVDLLARFYELILLDLGTGLTDPIARFALGRADQTVVVSTPEWVTAERVLDALADLDAATTSERLTVVLNQAPQAGAADRQLLEAAFRRAQAARRVAIPYDARLRQLLDAGAYDLDELARPTRVAVKQLALAVAEGLA